VAIADVQTTTTTAAYAQAALGISLESVSATQSVVQLQLM